MHKDVSTLWAHNAFILVCIYSHNNRRHCRVWRKQNVKYQAKLIQTTVKLPASVQIWGAISNRGQSLQRNVNGNMDSAKYQSDIIHDNEMTCERVVFLQRGYILCMISLFATTLKVLEYS